MINKLEALCKFNALLYVENCVSSSIGFPSKMSRRKCRGQNVADKMSRIKMSLIYNVALQNVANDRITLTSFYFSLVIFVNPASISDIEIPSSSSYFSCFIFMIRASISTVKNHHPDSISLAFFINPTSIPPVKKLSSSFHFLMRHNRVDENKA